jgi:GPH family glycoside/pentoside/hexuronide:cation symporter
MMNSESSSQPGVAPGVESASARVPMRTKLLWGAGGAADNIVYNGLANLVLPIFNVGLGIDAVKLGFAMGIPRFLDAITDPLIGNISDNTRSRWGRRRPYIFVGIILTGILLALLFNPGRGWSDASVFAWFLAVSCLLYVSYAVFVIPYSALGLEITSDYNERTRVLAWRPILGLVAGLGIPWLYKLCFVFGDTEAEGARFVAIFMGGAAIVLGLLPALFIKENPAAMHAAQTPLLSALRTTFTNRAFLLLTGSTLCILLGIFLAAPLGLYVSIYHVFGGSKESASVITGWAGTGGMVSGLLGVPLGAWLSGRLGKRHAALALLFLALLSVPLHWWMFTPANPWLLLVPTFVFGLAINGCFLVGASMLGDVCDADELESGQRREGVYSASLEFGKKCAIALSTVLVGFVLAAAGFSAKAIHQTPETILALRGGQVLVLGLSVVGAFGLIFFYPLSHQRATEIRRLLAERASAGGTPSS